MAEREEKQITQMTGFSLVSTMVIACIAELYMRQLRLRPELELSEKAALTSMITKIGNWLRDKVTFMSVSFPDMSKGLEAKLNIDHEVILDSSNVIDFIVRNSRYEPYTDFILDKQHRLRRLEQYEKLRAQGLSVEEAEKQLFA